MNVTKLIDHDNVSQISSKKAVNTHKKNTHTHKKAFRRKREKEALSECERVSLLYLRTKPQEQAQVGHPLKFP